MKTQLLSKTILFVAVLVIAGCDVLGNPARLTYELGEKGFMSYGSPYIEVTLFHEKGASIRNASCRLTARMGKEIVDTAFVYFADGGKIHAGDIVREKGIFFDLTSHDQYDAIEKDCNKTVE